MRLSGKGIYRLEVVRDRLLVSSSFPRPGFGFGVSSLTCEGTFHVRLIALGLDLQTLAFLGSKGPLLRTPP